MKHGLGVVILVFRRGGQMLRYVPNLPRLIKIGRLARTRPSFTALMLSRKDQRTGLSASALFDSLT